MQISGAASFLATGYGPAANEALDLAMSLPPYLIAPPPPDAAAALAQAAAPATERRRGYDPMYAAREPLLHGNDVGEPPIDFGHSSSAAPQPAAEPWESYRRNPSLFTGGHGDGGGSGQRLRLAPHDLAQQVRVRLIIFQSGFSLSLHFGQGLVV